MFFVQIFSSHVQNFRAKRPLVQVWTFPELEFEAETAGMEEGLGAPMTDKSNSGSARLYVGGCISYLFNGLV
jgi:hypothetical protein